MAPSGERRVFGPPGCGKTTYVARQVQNAVAKVGAGNVFVASFTRAAAAELAGRDMAAPCATLHAHAYRASTLSRLSISDGRVTLHRNRFGQRITDVAYLLMLRALITEPLAAAPLAKATEYGLVNDWGQHAPLPEPERAAPFPGVQPPPDPARLATGEMLASAGYHSCRIDPEHSGPLLDCERCERVCERCADGRAKLGHPVTAPGGSASPPGVQPPARPGAARHGARYARPAGGVK